MPNRQIISSILKHNLCLLLAITGAALVNAGCEGHSKPLLATTSSDWHEFQGTWTATGTRNVMHLLDDRRAGIADFDGSLVLEGASRPAVGFRVDAITFNDSTTGMVGRAVWTDEHGDQAFSALRGEGTANDNKIVGTFIGGTGRYAGATGTYEFSWRFVMEGEDGTVQGQSIGLHGRVRADSSHSISGTPGA